MYKICYIGNFDFTRKRAGSYRILNIAKTLSLKNEFEINFIGKSNVFSFVEQGFQVYNVRRGISYFERLYNHFCFAKQILKLLRKLPHYDIIIYYGSSAWIISALLKYCRKNNTKLLIDIVEWYDYTHLPFGRFGPFALDVHLAMTRLIPKCDGVIAISSYLEKYYKDRGCKVIRIPIILQTNFKINLKNKNIFNPEYLNLIYAGYPAKKDLIFNIIEAVNSLAKKNEKILLHIFGVSKTTLQKMNNSFSDKGIIFYGRVAKHEDLLAHIADADFSIFIKAPARYSNAQFPTKLVESFSLGVPVITNLTGDIGIYLKNDINGYIVDGYGSEEIYNSLKMILKISKDKYLTLKKNAKNTAVNNFDLRLYSSNLIDFIKKL